MNPWRLEWLRMTRSPRGLVLALVYLFFGFTAPLLARYLTQLAKLGSSGVQIVAPPPKAVDGIVNFVSQSSQTGLLVLVVVVAATATVGRSTLATIGTAVVVLLVVLPLAGAVHVVVRWLPTNLVRSPAGLLTGATVTGYLPAVAVSLAATAGLLVLATVRARNREPAS